METPTQKHKQLTAKLINIIEDFHKDNPYLFVESIYIQYRETRDGKKNFRGIEVKVIVQPSE